MMAGERVGIHQSTGMMRSPWKDGETCQSHQTEGNTDETETEKLIEIGGIEARLVVEIDAPLTLAAEVTEIGTGLLPLENLVGVAIDKMVPNRRHLLLVLNFQILSLRISWEGIVAH